MSITADTPLANYQHSMSKEDDLTQIKSLQPFIFRFLFSSEVTTLKMKLQQIMKGDYEYFMQKEIFEQPESITRTMAGRVPLEGDNVTLGGIKDFIPEIKVGYDVFGELATKHMPAL